MRDILILRSGLLCIIACTLILTIAAPTVMAADEQQEAPCCITCTPTPSPTPSSTMTPRPSPTLVFTPTPSPTETPTATPTLAPSPTRIATPTASPTPSPITSMTLPVSRMIGVNAWGDSWSALGVVRTTSEQMALMRWDNLPTAYHTIPRPDGLFFPRPYDVTLRFHVYSKSNPGHIWVEALILNKPWRDDTQFGDLTGRWFLLFEAGHVVVQPTGWYTMWIDADYWWMRENHGLVLRGMGNPGASNTIFYIDEAYVDIVKR